MLDMSSPLPQIYTFPANSSHVLLAPYWICQLSVPAHCFLWTPVKDCLLKSPPSSIFQLLAPGKINDDTSIDNILYSTIWVINHFNNADMFIECLLALQLYRKWCHLKSWIVGLLSIPSFPLPPHFIIKICHFLFWHSHFRSSELWHFSEGVKSQSLCLPLKPNMQMHLPSVCEGTVSNLSTSLVESGMEGGDGRRTPLLLSTLTQDLSPSPAQLFLSPKSKQCLTRERRGEKYWNPLVISPARRLREVKIFPLDLFCLQDFHFMQSTLPADPWFRRLPGKIWKAKK